MRIYVQATGAVLLVCLACVPLCRAQQIYKCKNNSGVFAYQQTPCANVSATQSVRGYTPVPDAPRNYAPQRRYASPTGYAAPSGSSAGSAMISGGGIMQNQQRYPTREEEAAARRAQRRSQGGTTATLLEQPTVVTDQYGGRYQKPPGSNIVIDERTGKPCFLVGQTLECH
ncbi:DUF4124 domain-containing protein [Lysobacter lacus]|uniref:DUF4124 domain-containing protein n=1 Tax=Cognatilysobacter lacus TaxID=1643323 RepID=A0A5D8YZV5_9GAMM|nr:DUF4124 domain-containing protein [Lysobacter lacus]